VLVVAGGGGGGGSDGNSGNSFGGGAGGELGGIGKPIEDAVVARVGPTVAALFDKDGRLFCSGVLIDAEHVLTAGHCGAAPPVKVVLDVVDARSEDGTARGVVGVDVEPGYWEGLDVALIRLDAPVDLVAPPVLLGCATNQLYDGAPAELVGFGATSPSGEADGRLYAVTMPIVDADCDDADRGCREAVAGSELIAGGAGLDSCSGDSGAPLFVWTDWGAPLLVGLVSRAAWPATTACGDGGIYPRLDALTACSRTGASCCRARSARRAPRTTRRGPAPGCSPSRPARP
jgi:secreted trypsin-like serine protease